MSLFPRKKYKNSNPIEAEFADGFILNEDDQGDVSLFDGGRNTFYDILNKLCETEHGSMIRFSLWVQGKRLDINWLDVPDNAKPIRFKHFEVDQNIKTGEVGEKRLMSITFGYEYLDKANNRNVQKTQEIT